MTPERAAGAVQMLRVLRSDIPADVARRDGMPLTGPPLATALGEMCAQIDALAAVLIEILGDPS